jgi:cbb3-type cytochrome oxidase subunit 3
MKSFPIHNKLQHYLKEHACLWIFLTFICVNWIRKKEKRERERERESSATYLKAKCEGETVSNSAAS